MQNRFEGYKGLLHIDSYRGAESQAYTYKSLFMRVYALSASNSTRGTEGVSGVMIRLYRERSITKELLRRKYDLTNQQGFFLSRRGFNEEGVTMRFVAIFLLNLLYISILSAEFPYGFYICNPEGDTKEENLETQYLHLRSDGFFIYTNLRGGFSAGTYRIENAYVTLDDGIDNRRFRFFIKGKFLTVIADKGGSTSGQGHLQNMMPVKNGSAATYSLANAEVTKLVVNKDIRSGRYEYWDSFKKQVHTLVLKSDGTYSYMSPSKKKEDGSYTFQSSRLTLKGQGKCQRVFNIIRIGNNLIFIRTGEDSAKGGSPLSSMKPVELKGALYEADD